MKYRFRVSKRPISPQNTPLPPARRRRLRLRGSDKPRPISRLPEPVEEILFEFGEMEPPKASPKKKKRERKKRLIPFVHRQLTRIWGGIALLFGALKRGIGALRRPKRQKRIHALPVLSGALCAALLVCALSAGTVVFGLFAGYGRAYESVTVPDFVGKDPHLVLTEEDTQFNLIIQYEKNDRVAEGLVISQAPHAGVRRRIYSADDSCNIVLTVSQPTEPYTLEELTGKTRRDAVLALRNRGVSPKIREEYSDSVPKGTVLSTLPASGTALSKGDSVILRVSLGKQIVLCKVPSLFGVTESRADALLRAASLKTGSITYQSSSLPAGTVIAQSVASGSSVESGSTVSYTVSAGDRYSLKTVPDLYGFTLSEAEAKLREYGLVLGDVYPVAGAASRGTVMTQSPLPGAPITSSTVTVDVYVIS